MSSDISEDTIRRIARDEAEAVVADDVVVEDGDGEEWSLRTLMERFEVSRRTALQALGLLALGYAAPRAVLQAVSGTAAAAADDNLTVPGTLDVDSVDYNSLTPDYRVAGPFTQSEGVSSSKSTSNGTYGVIYDVTGAVDGAAIPTNATLYGRFYHALRADTGETVFALPRFDTGVGSAVAITELEISKSGTGWAVVDSGWQEITSITPSQTFSVTDIRGKVSGGTGDFNYQRHGVLLAGVES